MPIYAYRCESCGLAKDVLQKMSDDVLTDCPACGAATFKKQVTAAGFQLKGSGWYATDFRNGSSSGEKPATSVPAPALDASKTAEATPAKSDVAATPTPASAAASPVASTPSSSTAT
jgi:putative FmdB family regulatory protein